MCARIQDTLVSLSCSNSIYQVHYTAMLDTSDFYDCYLSMVKIDMLRRITFSKMYFPHSKNENDFEQAIFNGKSDRISSLDVARLGTFANSSAERPRNASTRLHIPGGGQHSNGRRSTWSLITFPNMSSMCTNSIEQLRDDGEQV